MTKKNFFLIGGSMRSGTTLLGSIISNLSDTIVISDNLSWFWIHIFSKYQIRNQRDLLFILEKNKALISRILIRQGHSYSNLIQFLIENAPVKNDTSFEEILAILSSFYSKDLRTNIFFKVTHSAFIYEKFLQEVSGGKIIHMTRDKNEVLYSQYQKTKNINNYVLTSNKLILLFKITRNKVVNLVLEKSKNNYSIVQALLGRRNWTDLSFFKRAINYEEHCTEMAIDRYKSRILVINYNDLIKSEANCYKVLQVLISFINGITTKIDPVDFKKLIKNTAGNSSFGRIDLGIDFSRKRNIPNFIREINETE